MAKDDVMAVDQRLAQLEKTVAEGFFGQGERMGGLEQRMGGLEHRVGGLEHRMGRVEDRMSALDSKLDIFAENIRGDIKTVLEAVTVGTDEMRRTTESIRKEHEADRRLIKAILNDHAVRIRRLEGADNEPLEPR